MLTLSHLDDEHACMCLLAVRIRFEELAVDDDGNLYGNGLGK